jgi:hypothetical protein
MRGRQQVYILLGAHAAGGGASGKSLQACTSRPRGWARVPVGKSATTLGANAWERALTGGTGCGLFARL